MEFRTRSVVIIKSVRLLLLLAICALVVAILYFFARLIFAFTTAMYPAGALVYLPWSLGFCGLLGLVSVMRHPEGKSTLWYKADILLLSLGIAGVACILSFWFYLVGFSAFSPLVSGRSLFNGLFLTGLFLPVIMAVFEIHKARARVRAGPVVDNRHVWRVRLIILGLVFAGPVLRITGQEIVMLWYGRNLPEVALESAERLAGGDNYCLSDDFPPAGFDGLPVRRILIDAVDKRFGFHGFNYFAADPHFGIRINGQEYWWSFKEREFLSLGRFMNFSRKFRHCGTDPSGD